jgi:16S rRNA processing protein RimM
MNRDVAASSQGGQQESGQAEFVTVARVVKTQGRIGEVAATLLTDFPERFATRKKLFALRDAAQDKAKPKVEKLSSAGPAGAVQRRELQLEEHWFHKGMVVFKFAGVDSITDAEALIGCEIQIPRSERAELAADEIYVSDLVGCMVTDAGREIGQVRDVQFSGGEAPLLVVQGEKEYLVPFAAAYLEKIDIEHKRLSMKLPEGMLELDAPLTAEEKDRQHKKPG